MRAIQAGSVLVIWLLVKHQFLTPTPRTERAWYAVPAVSFVAVLVLLTTFPRPAHPGLEEPAVEASAQGRTPTRFGTPIPAGEAAAIQPPALPACAAARPPAPTTHPRRPTPGALPTATPVVTPAAGSQPTAAGRRAHRWRPARQSPRRRRGRPRRPRSRDRPLPASLMSRLSEYLTGPIKGTLEEQWFYSPELDRDMPYLAYLPPDYGTAGRRYPVLYMLHGLGGHRDELVAMGLVDAADRAMRNGDVAPMIVIMPQGDLSYWVNHAYDGPRWGEYLVHDVVPHIDATYRTLRSPAARAVGGISMGAWGALSNAFTHPRCLAWWAATA